MKYETTVTSDGKDWGVCEEDGGNVIAEVYAGEAMAKRLVKLLNDDEKRKARHKKKLRQ
jgi:hypothetical protein